MKIRHKSAFAVAAFVVLVLVLTTTANASDWGSFDASRINYRAGTLDGAVHTSLQSIIEDNGGTIVAPTSTLTADYLASVDVFYTSLLNTVTGTLSSDEQTALQNWIADGGTLIVTSDIFPLEAYESFTSVYGVTNYFDIGNRQFGNILAVHPITEGVATHSYHTNADFTYGADALLLADDGDGNDFMIVMEPATGFEAGGRILVLGDHNMFTNTFINGEDNSQLAANIVLWAGAAPDQCPADLDGDGNVGTGDLILLLGAWGDPYGTEDLIELLGAWGPCPK